jgi:protein MpaA
VPSISAALPAAAVLASAAVAAGLIIGPASATTSADPVVTPSPTATPSPTPTPTPVPTNPSLSQWPSQVTVGYSNKGRKIVAQRTGSPTAERVMLAIGIIHGNENKGKRIINKVRKKKLRASSDVQIWTIPSMNPDGVSANQRYNARGVDLNRNFPNGWWRGTRGAGRGPASEPETQALMGFMNKLRPDGTLVFHQDWNMVLGVCNSKTAPYAIQFASLAQIPREPCRRAFTGTMGSWANSALPGYLLTVELPGSRAVNGKKVKRWAKAVKKQALRLPNLDPTSPLPPKPNPTPSVTLD